VIGYSSVNELLQHLTYPTNRNIPIIVVLGTGDCLVLCTRAVEDLLIEDCKDCFHDLIVVALFAEFRSTEVTVGGSLRIRVVV
jgi:hypothetical protein